MSITADEVMDIWGEDLYVDHDLVEDTKQCIIERRPYEDLLSNCDHYLEKQLITCLRKSHRIPSPDHGAYFYVGELEQCDDFIDRPLVVLDFCCGLGGFSEEFVNFKNEEGRQVFKVFRFDIEPLFGRIEVSDANIVDLFDIRPEHLPQKPDIVLFSPPCTCFSVAAVSHHWPDYKPGPEAQLMIKLIRHGLYLINSIGASSYLIGNPRGMMRRVLGPPTVATAWAAWHDVDENTPEEDLPPLKPTDLWGIPPRIEWPEPKYWQKAPRGSRKGTQAIRKERDSGMFDDYYARQMTDAMLRAIIPPHFSRTLAEGLWGQMMTSLEMIGSCERVLVHGLET